MKIHPKNTSKKIAIFKIAYIISQSMLKPLGFKLAADYEIVAFPPSPEKRGIHRKVTLASGKEAKAIHPLKHQALFKP